MLRRAGLERSALPVAFATLAVFYAAWFGAMLLLRRKRSGELRAKQA